MVDLKEGFYFFPLLLYFFARAFLFAFDDGIYLFLVKGIDPTI